tara:strand:+ start:494 stop:709 length:216 start_codon:yes stop_codon:yes gene_type:complete
VKIYKKENMKNKFFSRKLLVFAIATALLVLEYIGENAWLILASVYVGVQMAQNAVHTYSNRTVGGRPNDRK